MKVLVGSGNPVKVEAVREAFSKYFGEVEVVPLAVGSGVSGQPTNDETFEGARNRALRLRAIDGERGLGAEFFVGLEGGAVRRYSRWFALGAMCVMDRKGRTGFGLTPHFELPASVAAQLLGGTELGDVMDRITGEDNTKQKGGAIGFLSKGVMDRKSLYVHGLVAALVPFMNEGMYFSRA
jgi:inosine/xanthosine triphosphatase